MAYDKYYYNSLNQNKLNEDFVKECENGDLEKVKYLLTSKELDKHAKINFANNDGLRGASYYNHLNVIKYLLTSAELKKHADIHMSEDYVFKRAYINDRPEIINYLVFEYKIEQTNEINEFIEEHKDSELMKMFEMRDLNDKLTNELPKQQVKKISVKM